MASRGNRHCANCVCTLPIAYIRKPLMPLFTKQQNW